MDREKKDEIRSSRSLRPPPSLLIRRQVDTVIKFTALFHQLNFFFVFSPDLSNLEQKLNDFIQDKNIYILQEADNLAGLLIIR